MFHNIKTLKTPTLFLLGFLFQLAISAVMFFKLSQQGQGPAVHDTYYLVSHFYYALNVGIFFIFFAAVYFSINRWTKRQYPEWAGRLHFAMFFIGINMSFYPQYISFGQRIPRRYIENPEAFTFLNKLSAYGGILTQFAFVFFLGLIIFTLIFGRQKAE